jgi:hypothetical protein
VFNNLATGCHNSFKLLTPLSVEHRKENATVVLPFPGYTSLTLICVEFGTYIYLKFVQV